MATNSTVWSFVRYSYRSYRYILQQGIFNKANNYNRLITTRLVGVSGGGALVYSWSLFGKKDELPIQSKGALTLRDVENICSITDILYKDYLVDKAFEILQKYRNSEHTELLWRLARVICEKGKQSKDINEKKTLFTEALEIAERALKYESVLGSFGAHKWYAIILNYASGIMSTKQQIAMSYQMKIHFERALELNAYDPTTWHLLGVWHYEFASMSSAKRLAARAFYAKLPDSNFEEALRHFARAEALQPGFYSANHYYLGLTYDHLKRKEDALKHMKKAFMQLILTEDDKDIHRRAGEYLQYNYPKIYEELKKEFDKS